VIATPAGPTATGTRTDIVLGATPQPVSTPIDVSRFPGTGDGRRDAGTVANGILGAFLVALGFAAIATGLRPTRR
jgi:hypothetical protein